MCRPGQRVHPGRLVRGGGSCGACRLRSGAGLPARRPPVCRRWWESRFAGMPSSACSSDGERSPRVSRSTMRRRAGSARAACLATRAWNVSAASIFIDSILTELILCGQAVGMTSLQPPCGAVPSLNSSARFARCHRRRFRDRRSRSSHPMTWACSCCKTAQPRCLGLTVLILVFGPVSGAHFNPVVSLADWFLGRRSGSGLSLPDLGALHAGPNRRRHRRQRARQRDVRSRHLYLHQGAGDRRSSAGRGSRDRRSGPADLLPCGHQTRRLGRTRRRCLYRRRVLVHILDVVREPGRDHRSYLQRHVRRHRTGFRRAVRCRRRCSVPPSASDFCSCSSRMPARPPTTSSFLIRPKAD